MPKNESRERCIYSTVDNLCDGTHPLHEKEHYLPAGLGEFANDKRLRNKICFRCQKDFGGLEDVFLHNSPEAFFRFLIGQRGRKREKKKNIFYEPTAKRPPLTITAKQPGEEYTVLWEMISQKEAKPMNQMVFRDGHGEYHHLPYRPGEVSSEQVLEFVNNNKIAKPELISYFFDNEESANQIELACKDYMKGK